jgi:hypothetical protein
MGQRSHVDHRPPARRLIEADPLASYRSRQRLRAVTPGDEFEINTHNHAAAASDEQQDRRSAVVGRGVRDLKADGAAMSKIAAEAPCAPGEASLRRRRQN